MVYVEGSLRTNQWEKDGQKRYTTEIIANEMQMLDSRGGADSMPSAGEEKTANGSSQDFGPPPEDDFHDEISF